MHMPVVVSMQSLSALHTSINVMLPACCPDQTVSQQRECLEILQHDPRAAAPAQVFIHDPLYNWALTAAAVRKRQRDDGSPEEAVAGTPAPTPALAKDRTRAAAVAVGNADAERTLLRVQAKLEGSESGVSCALQTLLDKA